MITKAKLKTLFTEKRNKYRNSQCLFSFFIFQLFFLSCQSQLHLLKLLIFTLQKYIFCLFYFFVVVVVVFPHSKLGKLRTDVAVFLA